MNDALWFLLMILTATAAIFAAGYWTGAESNPDIIRNMTRETTTITVNRTVNRTINRTVHRHEHLEPTIKRHVTTAPTPTRPATDITKDHDYTVTTADYGELHGNSMHPMIPPGATVLSEHYSDQPLDRGMIVRYRHPETDEPVIHQIVGVYDDCVRTKGVNRRSNDGCIDMDRISHVIVGVVWARDD